MACASPISRAANRGGFKQGGFPIWTCPSFFVLFRPFWDFPDFSGIFPICSGMVWGFSRFALFLFLGLLRAPTRNSPERVRDTIRTFPEKSGKHPGLETPRFSFSQRKRMRKKIICLFHYQSALCSLPSFVALAPVGAARPPDPCVPCLPALTPSVASATNSLGSHKNQARKMHVNFYQSPPKERRRRRAEKRLSKRVFFVSSLPP